MRTGLQLASFLCALCIAGTTHASTAKLPDRLELLILLKNEKFEALDQQLSHHQNQYEKGRSDEVPVGVAFSAFQNTEPWVRSKLKKWAKKSPSSYAAHFGSRGKSDQSRLAIAGQALR